MQNCATKIDLFRLYCDDDSQHPDLQFDVQSYCLCGLLDTSAQPAR